MAIPHNILRAVWTFDLGDPVQDIAQFGMYLWIHDETDFNDPSQDANRQDIVSELATDLAGSMASYWGDIDGLYSSQVVPRSCKVTFLGTNHLALNVAAAGVDADAGSGGDVSLPYECAVAVTLYGYDPGTFVADSRRRRGRFYLPPMNTGVMGDNGRLGASAISTLSTATDGFLEDVQGKVISSVSETHVDVVTVSAVGAGRKDQVFAHGIGDVVDSQRRRRNNQTEVRTYAVLSSH